MEAKKYNKCNRYLKKVLLPWFERLIFYRRIFYNNGRVYQDDAIRHIRNIIQLHKFFEDFIVLISKSDVRILTRNNYKYQYDTIKRIVDDNRKAYEYGYSQIYDCYFFSYNENIMTPDYGWSNHLKLCSTDEVIDYLEFCKNKKEEQIDF